MPALEVQTPCHAFVCRPDACWPCLQEFTPSPEGKKVTLADFVRDLMLEQVSSKVACLLAWGYTTMHCQSWGIWSW